MSSLPFVERQIKEVERVQKKQSAFAYNWDEDSFRVSPTCPPSTSVSFRGGWVWWQPGSGNTYGYYVPGYTVDLTDVDKVNMVAGGAVPYTYTFTNAYWYLPVMMVLANNCTSCGDKPLRARETWPDEIPDQSIYLTGMGDTGFRLDEYETAAEAENVLRTTGRWRTVTDSYGVVLIVVILRNNGNTSDPNQWMPVDKVNRGRSYLFRNIRPGYQWD